MSAGELESKQDLFKEKLSAYFSERKSKEISPVM
jgi:hypothetical protein